MYKIFPGEDRELQRYLLAIKMSETERHLVRNKFALAGYIYDEIIAYRKLSVKKGLVSSSKSFRRKKFIKQAGAFIKELKKH